VDKSAKMPLLAFDNPVLHVDNFIPLWACAANRQKHLQLLIQVLYSVAT
jgi:hypothetical protein